MQAAITVTAQDIAWGWLRTSTNQNAFREWARFVHGAIGLVELDLEPHPLGEAVLEALWDAAFGEPVTSEMTETMRRVVTGG